MTARSKKPETVWVVVVVESGVPILAEAHRDQNLAEQREQFFRASMREDYDEVGVFEVKIGSQLSV